MSEQPSTSSRPNVVLICVDQWRGDAFSIAGHPIVHTPYLDQLCLGGARFTRAYTATPSCIAARAALMTGLSQERHGRVGYRDGVPWDYERTGPTLAGEFTRHGYQTQAIGKMHVFPERTQLGFQNVLLHDGFLHNSRLRERDFGLVDDYLPWLRERDGADSDYFDHGVNCNSIVARPWDKAERLHPTNWVATQGIDFLRRRDPRKPFFLYLSFHRPHPPYDPPAWAFEQYLDAAMPDPPVGDWTALYDGWAEPHDPQSPVGEVDPRWLRRARAGYYGHMTHIDHQLNRFLEVLHEFRLRENTYVCFTSDHGELMGDHHLFRKSLPYEGSARVPLLLKGPRDAGITPGITPTEAAELRDVMPTLLDCAGLPIPEGLDGRSLLPLARGESVDWRLDVHGEHTTLGQSAHWLTDGREKYIWLSGSGDEQLFDLSEDPQELHDLSRRGDPRLQRWRDRMVLTLRDRPEGFVSDGALVPGRPVSPILEGSLAAESARSAQVGRPSL
ncbi:MAG TPA: arylsulfatase [Chloroflexota bacterium]|nr:arylsulfatase [Chloroflexota bacterium]